MNLTKFFKSKRRESTSLQSSSLSSTDSSATGSSSSSSSLSHSERRQDGGRPSFLRRITRGKSSTLSKQTSKHSITSMEVNVNVSSFKSEVTSSFTSSGVTRTQSLPIIHRQQEIIPTGFVAELAEVFKVFDVNNDGKISAVELGNILRALGDTLSDEELERMVAEHDHDGDGHIDLDEFIAINTAAGEDIINPEESIEAAFHMFDTDRKGSITSNELYRVISGLGDSITLEECQEIISRADKDGDGQVNFNDFQMLMNTTPIC